MTTIAEWHNRSVGHSSQMLELITVVFQPKSFVGFIFLPNNFISSLFFFFYLPTMIVPEIGKPILWSYVG